MSFPITYLLTFTCYGTRLHGEGQTVDRDYYLPATPFAGTDPKRASMEQRDMDQGPYELDAGRRDAVLGAIREVCRDRDWPLFAAHVRRHHVHIVVQARTSREAVLNTFKAYASRRLSSHGFDDPFRKRWTRHGSTRYIWKEEDLEAVIRYVLKEQGEPMAVFWVERAFLATAP
jgi:REP element-mobilizing transposase RayT